MGAAANACCARQSEPLQKRDTWLSGDFATFDRKQKFDDEDSLPSGYSVSSRTSFGDDARSPREVVASPESKTSASAAMGRSPATVVDEKVAISAADVKDSPIATAKSEIPVVISDKDNIVVVKFAPGRLGMLWNKRSVVTRLDHTLQAFCAGVRCGWRIVSVNDTAVEDAKSLAKRIQTVRSERFSMSFERPTRAQDTDTNGKHKTKSETNGVMSERAGETLGSSQVKPALPIVQPDSTLRPTEEASDVKSNSSLERQVRSGAHASEHELLRPRAQVLDASHPTGPANDDAGSHRSSTSVQDMVQPVA